MIHTSDSLTTTLKLGRQNNHTSQTGNQQPQPSVPTFNMKLTSNKCIAITAIVFSAATQTLAQRSNQGMGPLLDLAQVKKGDTIRS
jgi:hypothetical protein